MRRLGDGGESVLKDVCIPLAAVEIQKRVSYLIEEMDLAANTPSLNFMGISASDVHTDSGEDTVPALDSSYTKYSAHRPSRYSTFLYKTSALSPTAAKVDDLGKLFGALLHAFNGIVFLHCSIQVCF